MMKNPSDSIALQAKMNKQTAASIRAERRKKFWLQVPAYVILGAWAFFTIFVLGWVLVSSFKSNQEIFKDVFNFPKVWQFTNYVKAWNAAKFALYFKNSLIITFLAVAGILLTSAPAAYILSRFQFKGRDFISMIFIAGMGIPVSLVLIPLYVMLNKIGLVNTFAGLIIVYISLSIPFTVYILTGFFGSLPKELEEAAIIDGCTDFEVFWHIMLPLASPGLLTAAIFNGISLWNEYQLVLVFIGDGEKRTLALGLYSLQSAMQYTGDWVGLFAGVSIVMVPTILLFIVLSEKMISGITMGATK
jgi:ABC-type glycerol-3-phosphate transport system permease component